MNLLNIKPNHKVVKEYYKGLSGLGNLSLFHEGAVSPAFASLLRYCGRQLEWTLAEQFTIKKNGKSIRVDGALLDNFKLRHGVWEAKDSDDVLESEVKKKFEKGYPNDNIIFQEPGRAIIWQDGKEVINSDITKPDNLIEALNIFFSYTPPEYNQWEEAVEEFKNKVPELANGLLELIEEERKSNTKFIDAFEIFEKLCRDSINPNISVQALEEMLIQHLLTERIFRKVFDNPDFAKNNIIACEIEKVVKALTSKYFSRKEFLKKLDRFYIAIEKTAATISDYSQKQSFLNTVYENFFQGFSVEVADTHGIVYTPQPIVDFIVNSVETILGEQFGRSLSAKEVHVLDPFVGTGNFLIRIMRAIKKTALEHKYSSELHCNEVMLLPYYIACMNIEHEFYELSGEYKPFNGICLVDTFELAEDKQMSLFTAENTERVNQLKKTPIFVILGNPPYNMGQVNENDNNKNRKYPVIDSRVMDTYSKDSNATLKNKLADPYVKAIRWATDRISENGEGIVALITNSSFAKKLAFDGMRKHLGRDFDKIYILDLGGDVRENPKLSGSTHNVFGIQVGVSINFLIKKSGSSKEIKIYYAKTDEYWKKEQKYKFLENKKDYTNVKFMKLKPDEDNNWLTESLKTDFKNHIHLGLKQAGKDNHRTIFSLYSCGVLTSRDNWLYNFDTKKLAENVKSLIKNYNFEAIRYLAAVQEGEPLDNIDNFVNNDPSFIKWSDRLKSALIHQTKLVFDKSKIRNSLYRPFCRRSLYFDSLLNQRRYQQHHLFPIEKTEKENIAICVTSPGTNKPFHCLVTDCLVDYHLLGDTQCFPFYSYDEDGTNRQENITDEALDDFRKYYKKQGISKWDIFYYIYGILNHPKYVEKYAANLKKKLPRIPYVNQFQKILKAGKRLSNLHLNHESIDEYELELIEDKNKPLDWKVNKLRISNDKSKIIYNESLLSC